MRKSALAAALLWLPIAVWAQGESGAGGTEGTAEPPRTEAGSPEGDGGAAPGAAEADGGTAEPAAITTDVWKLPFSVESIQTVVQLHQTEVQSCYEEILAEGQDVQGVVVLAFTIAPQGVVSRARVKSTTLRNTRVERCLVDTLRRWYFPRPKRTQSVEFPFRFSEVGGKAKPQPAAKAKAKAKRPRKAR